MVDCERVTAEVLIIGGGCSGVSTALTLHSLGIDVIVAEQRNERATDGDFIVGESFPLSCVNIVSQLNVDLAHSHHLPVSSMRSLFGLTDDSSADLLYRQSLTQSDSGGYGLTPRHVDRITMQSQLWSALIKENIPIRYQCKFRDAQRTTTETKSEWTTQCDRLNAEPSVTSINSKWIVDCSGRSAVVARTLSPITIHDKLTAVYALFRCVNRHDVSSRYCDNDRTGFIEAVSDGWYYSCIIHAKLLSDSDTNDESDHYYRIVYFFTDNDLSVYKRVRSGNGFRSLIDSSTIHLKGVMSSDEYQYEWAYPMNGRPAACDASSRERANIISAESQWISVGDAAMTYDPISSQGMLAAFTTGIMAANVIAKINESAKLSDKNNVKNMELLYETTLHHFMQNFQHRRKEIYQNEKRFLTSEFWKRRREKEKNENEQ